MRYPTIFAALAVLQPIVQGLPIAEEEDLFCESDSYTNIAPVVQENQPKVETGVDLTVSQVSILITKGAESAGLGQDVVEKLASDAVEAVSSEGVASTADLARVVGTVSVSAAVSTPQNSSSVVCAMAVIEAVVRANLGTSLASRCVVAAAVAAASAGEDTEAVTEITENTVKAATDTGITGTAFDGAAIAAEASKSCKTNKCRVGVEGAVQLVSVGFRIKTAVMVSVAVNAAVERNGGLDTYGKTLVKQIQQLGSGVEPVEAAREIVNVTRSLDGSTVAVCKVEPATLEAADEMESLPKTPDLSVLGKVSDDLAKGAAAADGSDLRSDNLTAPWTNKTSTVSGTTTKFTPLLESSGSTSLSSSFVPVQTYQSTSSPSAATDGVPATAATALNSTIGMLPATTTSVASPLAAEAEGSSKTEGITAVAMTRTSTIGLSSPWANTTFSSTALTAATFSSAPSVTAPITVSSTICSESSEKSGAAVAPSVGETTSNSPAAEVASSATLKHSPTNCTDTVGLEEASSVSNPLKNLTRSFETKPEEALSAVKADGSSVVGQEKSFNISASPKDYPLSNSTRSSDSKAGEKVPLVVDGESTPTIGQKQALNVSETHGNSPFTNSTESFDSKSEETPSIVKSDKSSKAAEESSIPVDDKPAISEEDESVTSEDDKTVTQDGEKPATADDGEKLEIVEDEKPVTEEKEDEKPVVEEDEKPITQEDKEPLSSEHATPTNTTSVDEKPTASVDEKPMTPGDDEPAATEGNESVTSEDEKAAAKSTDEKPAEVEEDPVAEEENKSAAVDDGASAVKATEETPTATEDAEPVTSKDDKPATSDDERTEMPEDGKPVSSENSAAEAVEDKSTTPEDGESVVSSEEKPDAPNSETQSKGTEDSDLVTEDSTDDTTTEPSEPQWQEPTDPCGLDLEECYGTLKWCLKELYKRDNKDFENPKACMLSRKNHPAFVDEFMVWKKPSSEYPGCIETTARDRFAFEACVGTEYFCDKNHYSDFDEEFENAEACKQSRSDRPEVVENPPKSEAVANIPEEEEKKVEAVDDHKEEEEKEEEESEVVNDAPAEEEEENEAVNDAPAEEEEENKEETLSDAPMKEFIWKEPSEPLEDGEYPDCFKSTIDDAQLLEECLGTELFCKMAFDKKFKQGFIDFADCKQSRKKLPAPVENSQDPPKNETVEVPPKSESKTEESADEENKPVWKEPKELYDPADGPDCFEGTRHDSLLLEECLGTENFCKLGYYSRFKENQFANASACMQSRKKEPAVVESRISPPDVESGDKKPSEEEKSSVEEDGKEGASAAHVDDESDSAKKDDEVTSAEKDDEKEASSTGTGEAEESKEETSAEKGDEEEASSAKEDKEASSTEADDMEGSSTEENKEEAPIEKDDAKETLSTEEVKEKASTEQDDEKEASSAKEEKEEAATEKADEKETLSANDDKEASSTTSAPEATQETSSKQTDDKTSNEEADEVSSTKKTDDSAPLTKEDDEEVSLVKGGEDDAVKADEKKASSTEEDKEKSPSTPTEVQETSTKQADEQSSTEKANEGASSTKQAEDKASSVEALFNRLSSSREGKNIVSTGQKEKEGTLAIQQQHSFVNKSDDDGKASSPVTQNTPLPLAAVTQ
ncbi:hypothetical protein CP532_0915 [Ophiocordyceps camponoti-leonardi (nom. inval.)]|nr:hypothetical protein CP532_0915 [Ophiocordyceps camponoti-leonardi (nom. inval.)]